jgi:aerobic-type carbon monoxide dehydrogenase small subunit (CoxS/CutS family)
LIWNKYSILPQLLSRYHRKLIINFLIIRGQGLKMAEKVKGKVISGKMAKERKVSETHAIGTTSGKISVSQSPPSPDISTVKMIVNRRPYEFQVEPNWPLRDVLREKLGLTSVKDFCSGYGACGSCTVIMNGRPVLSCTLLAVECDGAVIETAEGIADSNHPLVEAYIMNWTAQCGYCTPGFLVTAKALLDRNPDPTAEEIKEALAGNLCRCGTYVTHIKAVQQAAKILKAGK